MDEQDDITAREGAGEETGAGSDALREEAGDGRDTGRGDTASPAWAPAEPALPPRHTVQGPAPAPSPRSPTPPPPLRVPRPSGPGESRTDATGAADPRFAARPAPPPPPAATYGAGQPAAAAAVPAPPGPPLPPPPPSAGAALLAGGPAAGRATRLGSGARTWGFPEVVLGVTVGFAPQVLLYVAALSTGTLETDTTMQTVTLLGALAVLGSTLFLYGWQAAAAWIFSLRLSREGLAGWGFTRPSAAFFWTIPVALGVSYAVSAVHQVLLDPPPQDIVEQFPRSVAGGVLFAIVAVILAPLFEEVFFRGFVYVGLRRSWGWWPAALGSALVFSLVHLQMSIFVPIFVLGVALAWVYERTGSLWTSIAMHAVFNGLAVLAWSLGAG